MRILIAISILVASVSSASAQFAMDHGNAAAAAQAIRAEQAYQNAKAAAIANGGPLLPSQQTNFAVGGRATIKVLQRTAEEKKADEVGAGCLARALPADRGRGPRGTSPDEICGTGLRSFPLQHRRQLKSRSADLARHAQKSPEANPAAAHRRA